MAVQRCHSITTRGKRCKRFIEPGHRYCWQHQDRPIRTRDWWTGLIVSAVGGAITIGILPLFLYKPVLTPFLLILGLIPFMIGRAMMYASKFNVIEQPDTTPVIKADWHRGKPKYHLVEDADEDDIAPHKQYLLDELDEDAFVPSEEADISTDVTD